MAERHDFNLPGDTPHYAPDRFYRARHLKLEIAVDPARKRVDGTATYTLEPAPVPPRGETPQIVLDAAEMEITEVSPAKSWSHEEGKLVLEPDQAYPDRPRQVWTQCQAEDARYWLPSFDFPNQKLTTELIASVPSGL